jgi:hypothetical protein
VQTAPEMVLTTVVKTALEMVQTTLVETAPETSPDYNRDRWTSSKTSPEITQMVIEITPITVLETTHKVIETTPENTIEEEAIPTINRTNQEETKTTLNRAKSLYTIG